jgi:signal transduction histidine kinase/DNA-binding NarL/FixJ family response regulator
MRKEGRFLTPSFMAPHVSFFVLALGAGLSFYSFYSVYRFEPADRGLIWQNYLVPSVGLVATVYIFCFLQILRIRRQKAEQLARMRTEEVETTLAQLKLTEGRLNDFILTASDWHWEAGPDYRFTSVADRAREHGIDPGALIGLAQLIEGDAHAAIEKRLEVLDRHEPFKDLRYDYGADDHLLVVSLSGVPKFGENGRFRGYRGSARDITPQLRAEAEQRAARWAAELANNAKSTFLANMSHEIRTPMNGVLGMVEILSQTNLSDDQRRMCEIISHSGSALLQILNDILDFSKLEAGKIELESIDCRLTDVLSDVISLMRHSAEPKGISLVFEHDAAADTKVVGDPTRLRQIVLNLVSNAIKFSKRGSVVIRLETEATADHRLSITLSVADQGIGMSQEEQQRIFRRFSQADISLTRRFGGTGLGLAIIQELIILMGGNISLQSKLGEGSTFTVRLDLPLAAQQSDPSRAAPDVERAGPQAYLRVLVAEDDPVNRLVIRMLLKNEGHEVVLVENGFEALQAVQGEAFDLVLMDIMMPQLDGVSATRRIRELPTPASGIPIIALTANAMKGDRDSYLASGMNAYVSKPIAKKQLFATIEQILRVRVWNPSAQDAGVAQASGTAALSKLEQFITSL